MLIVQKRVAPSENATAVQSSAIIFVPIVRRMPYVLRTELKVPVSTEKRIVLVSAARKQNKVAVTDTMVVTHEPRREQMARRPTTILASDAKKATAYATNIQFATAL